MKQYTAKSVCQGVAIGTICVYSKGEAQVKRVKIEDAAAEIERFEAAKAQAIAQLGELYEKAVKDVGEMNAAIFEIHQMMLEDDGFIESIHGMIENQMVNAEYLIKINGHVVKITVAKNITLFLVFSITTAKIHTTMENKQIKMKFPIPPHR